MAMVIEKTTKQQGNKARRRGAAAVEFALVALPLLLLLIGLIDYGWMFLKAQQITQAARAGARTAIVADSTNAKVANTISTWMTQAGIETYTYTVTPADVSTVAAGGAIKVDIKVMTNTLALANTAIVPVPAELHGIASMAKEGPN